MPCWHKLLAWPEGITVWVILFTLGAIGWQSYETRKAAEAARHGAKAQMDADRAWILVKIVGQPKEPLTGSLIRNIIPAVIWEIQIFGNTPARIIREEYRCRIVPPDPTAPSKPLLEQIPKYLPDPNFVEGRIVSPPGEKHLVLRTLESELGTVMMEAVSQVVIGRAFFCSYGRIEYEDAFKRRGTTQFCAIYRPPIGGALALPDGTPINSPGFYIGGPCGYNYNS